MGKAHYSPGDRIGRLSLIEDSGERKQRCIVWKCRCDCGGIIYLDTKTLERGTWLSCGCDKNVTPRMRDLTGKRFGKLVCMEYAGTDSKFGGALWKCRCDCGNEVTTTLRQLVSGKKRSCGCLAREVTPERLKLVDGTSLNLIERHSNDRLSAHNSSGHNGVYLHRRTGKWAAKIQFRRKTYHLGLFSNINDAVKARATAEEKMFGSVLEAQKT